MANTLNNVPRELLEISYDAIHALMGMGIEGFTADRCKEMRHILSAQSPAGVDGLSASAMPDEVFAGEFAAWWEEDGKYVRAGGSEYERSFAFQAWRHLYPMLMQARSIAAARQEVANDQHTD